MGPVPPSICRDFAPSRLPHYTIRGCRNENNLRQNFVTQISRIYRNDRCHPAARASPSEQNIRSPFETVIFVRE